MSSHRRLTIRDAGNSQTAALNDELKSMKSRFDDLQAAIKRHEATISSKQRQIVDLESQLAASAKMQQASDQAKTALQVKLDALSASLGDRDNEKRNATAARQKLEKELDDLRKVMADKSSEDVRRREADKSREAEMARLRDQVLSGEKARDEQQRAQTEFANTLRVQVEGLQSQHKSAEKDLKAARSELTGKEAEIARIKGAMERLEESMRMGAKELADIREQMSHVDAKLRSTSKARDVSTRESSREDLLSYRISRAS